MPPPPVIGLELAAPGDLEALLALEERCFPSPISLSRRQFQYLFRRPTVSVYVLRQGGQIVGDAVILRRRGRSGALTARLYSLAVDAACRGQGLGRAILTKCIRLLRAEGARSVGLEVAVENTPAIRLYESLGFVRTGHAPDYYAPGGHALKMKLELR